MKIYLIKQSDMTCKPTLGRRELDIGSPVHPMTGLRPELPKDRSVRFVA